jgi:hypothetical protein
LRARLGYLAIVLQYHFLGTSETQTNPMPQNYREEKRREERDGIKAEKARWEEKVGGPPSAPAASPRSAAHKGMECTSPFPCHEPASAVSPASMSWLAVPTGPTAAKKKRAEKASEECE